MIDPAHLIRAVLLIALLSPVTAEAASISGKARVLDGNNLMIGPQRIRLFGIAAPEVEQSCTLDGKVWACGADVATALHTQIGERVVTCEERGIDRDKRVVAICRIGALDLGDWMVRNGWALADRRSSMMYVSAEFAARNNRMGLWRAGAQR
jgi:endonuclease YncB( thermonuclease family)